MNETQKNLDRLKARIQERDFLEGTGINNEVNIRFFCYEPKDEPMVQAFTERLKADKTLKCRILERNLYETMLGLCEDAGIVEAIPEMEKENGSAYLIETLNRALGAESYVDKMDYEPHEHGKDVLLITGVGEVFPYMRIHTLLEALQPRLKDIAVVVMYPGRWDGVETRLFNLLKPNAYYRAISAI